MVSFGFLNGKLCFRCKSGVVDFFCRALQIGAPRANLTDKKFKEPGGVYRCLLHGPCKLYYVDEKDYGKGGSGDEEYETKKDEAFIGVSMDVKEGKSGGKNVVSKGFVFRLAQHGQKISVLARQGYH